MAVKEVKAKKVVKKEKAVKKEVAKKVDVVEEKVTVEDVVIETVEEETEEEREEVNALEVIPEKVEQAKKGKEKFWSGLGRRKSATARVWLFEGRGDILVNDKLVDDYFSDIVEPSIIYLKPFHSVGVSHPKSHFSASVKVSGGGRTAQLGAIQLAISKALVSYNEEHRPQLRKFGLLTTDARKVERKKYYFVKARKRPQFSKR